MSEFKLKDLEYIKQFEKYANGYFDSLDEAKSTLLTPMKYSFFAGGKRIRPLLAFASAETCNCSFDRILPFAYALECIHTYSLIHDDLPAMDNDDYRRGKLTSHKVFGEAIAILTGDSLLNLAFSVATDECVKFTDSNTCKCAKILADNAGVLGMIGGQTVDILSEKQNVQDKAVLEYIENNKTGKLICTAVEMPYILSGKNQEKIREFGQLLGVQFQIVDDILDVESNLETMGKTVGKDDASGKLTYVSMFGLNQAKQRSKEIYNQCKELLKEIDNSDYLSYICDALYERLS